MKVGLIGGIKFPFFMILLGLLGFSSCRTARNIEMVEAKPMSTGKLLKQVEKNAFDYSYFSIKRINCQFSDNFSKASFKVNLKAHRDNKILVSISKLNIPVGRVLLTPDSVKYVNYIDKNFFTDDYSYLSKVLNIDLDFATIQSIISNNAFSYRNDPKDRDFKTFDSFIENGHYVLQSEKERKLVKIEEKGKTAKADRRLKRLDEDALILQKMFFEPVNFALTKLIIEDKTNERQLLLTFDDFEEFEKKDYPGLIDMNFNSPENDVNLKVRMSGFSAEKVKSFSLRIPEKYEEIRVN
ncbi:DUF4292 domain-containing protein [Maribellus maritimus]|uniref:DUF4292 domain-containing protein n=1 Tax=Maribellus maritimus TaxID=2870838 RepID=UPI001EEA0924|nr:DUF4292 domain-containing protein [Maribellus maritimus]MCG6190732.1 DUF4292 domain-containing protein [Maribellus maritimus]